MVGVTGRLWSAPIPEGHPERSRSVESLGCLSSNGGPEAHNRSTEPPASERGKCRPRDPLDARTMAPT